MAVKKCTFKYYLNPKFIKTAEGSREDIINRENPVQWPYLYLLVIEMIMMKRKSLVFFSFKHINDCMVKVVGIIKNKSIRSIVLKKNVFPILVWVSLWE